MSTRVDVDAGVCGFCTSVRAASEDGQNVVLDIKSGCEKIRGLGDALKAQGPLDAYDEISAHGKGTLMSVVRQHLKGCCAGCAVPAGIFKGMQVAAGLALPKDAVIRLTVE